MLQCRFDTGGILRLNANDARVGPDIAQVGRHAGKQTAATTAHEHIIQRLVCLTNEFYRDRRLTSDDIGIIERMNKRQTLFLNQGLCAKRRLVKGIAIKDHSGSQCAHRIDLDRRCRHGHYNLGLDTELRCRQCHTLGMITRRGRHDTCAPGCLVKVNHLVIGAATLERKNRLQVFALEKSLIVDTRRQQRRAFQGRLARNIVDLCVQDSLDVRLCHLLKVMSKSSASYGFERINTRTAHGKMPAPRAGYSPATPRI